MYLKTAVLLLLTLLSNSLYSQDITEDIKGKITDNITGEPIIGATVTIEDSTPFKGTVTDLEGSYTLKSINVGRHTIVISSIGYNQERITEVLLTSAKAFILDVSLETAVYNLDGVVVTAREGQDAYNTMATVSSRSFTVEESSRLAGGLSDPSRVAYNFAGVTFSAPQDNGVVIRGNSPSSVLWRLNGIDVSGIAHFAGGNLAGAGLISAYSANMLKGSDFFTGAYPAEYSNSTSGAFDIDFRKGDSDQHKYLAQIGILGLDLASEGPLKREGKSSYLVNYRHGFIGYYGALVNATEPHFKDLSFNLDIPTEKCGDFSIWGIGGLSKNIVPNKRYREKYEKDDDEVTIKRREYFNDFLDKDIEFGIVAVGISHKKSIGDNSFLSSNIGFTKNSYSNETRLFHPDADTLNSGYFTPYQDLSNIENKFEFSSTLYSQLGSKISNETGIRADIIVVNSHSAKSENSDQYLSNIYSFNEVAKNFNTYTQFKYDIVPSVTINAGLASTLFSEVNEITIEPRLGLKWQYLKFSSLSLAYGKHTKREEIKTYFYRSPENGERNILELSKSNHYVASLDFDLSKSTSIRVESYYQSLYDVPVIEDTPYSFINYTTMWNINGPISNRGTGTNIGIDLSLERTMTKGLYYLLTASIFDSKYIDAQKVERNTLYNRNYLTTLAIGKEFVIKGKNLLGFNVNGTYMGGGRLTPYLTEESHEAKKIIYDSDRLYENQADTEIWLNAGITYKVNRERSTVTWGLDFQNALLTEQMAGYKYNLNKNSIDEDKVLFLLPNFFYKIEF